MYILQNNIPPPGGGMTFGKKGEKKWKMKHITGRLKLQILTACILQTYINTACILQMFINAQQAGKNTKYLQHASYKYI